MYDRGESPHMPLTDLQLHPWYAQLLPWFLDPRSWTVHLTSGIVVRMRIGVWICYSTVFWVTTYDMGGSPHRPHHDLQLNSRHAQLLPWFSKSRAWTMHLTSGVVVGDHNREWYAYIQHPTQSIKRQKSKTAQLFCQVKYFHFPPQVLLQLHSNRGAITYYYPKVKTFS